MADKEMYINTEEVVTCIAQLKSSRDDLKRLIDEITKVVNSTQSIYVGDAADEMRKKYKESFVVNAKAYIKQLDTYIKFATDAKISMEAVDKKLNAIAEEKAKKMAATASASVSNTISTTNNILGWK